MRVTADRKALAEAAEKVARFLPGRLAVPALNHIRIEAHSNIVALTATDWQMGRRVEVEANIGTEGEALLPPEFVRLVSGGSGDEVALDASETEVAVRIGRARAKLRTTGSTEAPFEPEMDGKAIRIPIESWDRLRAVCVAAAGPKAQRPTLEAVQLAGGMAACTDHYRLATTRVAPPNKHPAVLIPARAVLTLDADVSTLVVDERHVKAVLDDGAWWTRRIDGPFPKWSTLIPSDDPASTLTVDSKSLIGAAKRAMATTGSPLVTVTTDGTTLTVGSTSGDRGEYAEDVLAAVGGEPVKVIFTGRYLIDAVTPVDEVRIDVRTETGPVMITADWWQILVMPVRP